LKDLLHQKKAYLASPFQVRLVDRVLVVLLDVVCQQTFPEYQLAFRDRFEVLEALPSSIWHQLVVQLRFRLLRK
jgi:hypothetical protein